MIEVRGLRISFGGRTVIDGIDLSVPAGSTLVLMGKNGAGKSIVLKALSGLVDYEGSVAINGTDIRELYRDRTGRAGGLRVAYVFQKGGLFDSMNVFDNVAFGLRRLGEPEESIPDLVASSLARVGLRGASPSSSPSCPAGCRSAWASPAPCA